MRHVREPEQIDTRKEAPTVEINTTYVAATRVGAAFPVARSAWTGIAGLGVNLASTQIPVLGVNHARTQINVSAAGRPDARCAAFRLVPAQTMQLSLMSTELPPVNGNRKQTNVHKTRISAGGYGAMGPHPEREPA
jgi:hypothetical protein